MVFAADPNRFRSLEDHNKALFLCSQVLLQAGDVAWMEDPGYPGARAALVGANANIVPIPVDSEGLVVATRNIKRRPEPKLVYVTPSHQCPLGMTMGLSRRLELLDFASQVGAWIVEDDYDSEYRYFSRPVASLQSLDANGRVIYVGTVSKTLAPALRNGYFILPESLIEMFARARATMDRQPAGVDQAVSQISYRKVAWNATSDKPVCAIWSGNRRSSMRFVARRRI